MNTNDTPNNDTPNNDTPNNDPPNNDPPNNDPPNIEANFSTLVMSIGSSALMAMGLAPQPEGKTEKDIKAAEFNIDLLKVLHDKTQGNLTEEEKQFLINLLSDLQMQFIKNQ